MSSKTNSSTSIGHRQSAPRVVVIGAGAAGMMAAAEAAGRGATVTLLEKNAKTGVKILMSGGTRCNITHDTDARGITEAFGHARRFLQPSVGAFDPAAVIAMFTRLGVATKRESTGKFFPQSDRAVDVRDALHRQMVNAGVTLHLKTSVAEIRPPVQDGQPWAIATTDSAGQHVIDADRVIVTAGGKSWPGCGTTGDAYAWLESLGHRIVRPRPALVPLVGGTDQTRDLSGLTLPDVAAVAAVPGAAGSKKPRTLARRSSLLLTHFGFSGPLAMDVSGLMTSADDMQDAALRLDLLPDWGENELRQTFRDAVSKARGIRSLLGQWLPSRMADLIAATCPTDRPAELSKSATHGLIEHLKRWHVPITDTKGFDKAEVTAGGVALDEVDPRTMASRRREGLFIAGEVLDVDGWIGGYNFQAAFSTGRAAAIAAAR